MAKPQKPWPKPPKWNNVDQKLPTKTDVYSVHRKVTTNPIYAVYSHVTKKWMVIINGQYWEIVGVQFWMEKPGHPTHRKL